MSAPTVVTAPGTWTLQSATAEFLARDVLRKQVRGTLPVRTAQVEVDGDGRVSGVTAELDTSGVTTGHPKRDRDLRGRTFFDVDGHPVLRFVGGPAHQGPDGRWTLPGHLQLKGASCPVELDVELLAATSELVRVRATASLDRRAAGICVPRLLVGTQVQIRITAELARGGPTR